MRVKEVPWIIKYRPKRLYDVINQDKAKEVVVEYLKLFPKYKKKALLFWGPPGTGKTSLVYAVANEYGYEVLEVNASDKRDYKSVRDVIGNALKHTSLFMRKRIILIDEVDGISGTEDKGGIATLIEVIEESRNPVILTANDPWKENLKPLRNVVEMVEFKPLNPRLAVKYLQRICLAEKIKCEYVALLRLLEKNNGDLRSAINDLQSLASVKKEIKIEDVEGLGERDKEKNIFECLKILFKTTNIFTAMSSTENVQDLDPEEILAWIEENISIEYKDFDEIEKAYDYVSKADIWFSRIIRTQYWRFLVYANIDMTAGVSLSKKKVYRTWTRYQPPTRIKKLVESKRYRDLLMNLAKRLSEKIHCSLGEALSIYIPLIAIIYRGYKKKVGRAIKMYEKIKKRYKIDKYEEEALSKILLR